MSNKNKSDFNFNDLNKKDFEKPGLTFVMMSIITSAFSGWAASASSARLRCLIETYPGDCGVWDAVS